MKTPVVDGNIDKDIRIKGDTVWGAPFSLQEGGGRDIFEINNLRQEDGKINYL